MSENARRGPTMHDVAAIAGVSHVTVSRVLNDYPSIRPETRDRVLAAIAALGYRRNLAARALVTSRSRAIGVLTPTVAEYGPASSVLAIEAAARDLGYHPLVTAAAVDREATLASLEFLLDQSVEALVVIAPHRQVLEAIRDLEITIPLATLQSPGEHAGLVVGVDQSAGAVLATRHLIEAGHRVIQHVAGPAGYFEAEARRRGYHQALAAAGLVAPPELAGDWSAASGHRAAALIDPTATAIFCANDQMALGLLAGLSERGTRVPAELSVVGFDDIPESAFFQPALTTVHQDFDLVGRRVVEVLAARLAGEEVDDVVLLEPWLVVRDSTRHVDGRTKR
jgi:DNA-binding LacI/PurR family transcriptional regulator